MHNTTRLLFGLYGLGTVLIIIHIAIFKLLHFNEPFLFLFGICAFAAFALFLFFAVLQRINKGYPADLWRVGFLGFTGFAGSLKNDKLHYMYLLFLLCALFLLFIFYFIPKKKEKP